MVSVWHAILPKEILEVPTLFYKKLGSDPSRQSCLYLQVFQGSKLINGLLSSKQVLSVFQEFFGIHHWHIVYRVVSQRTKQFFMKFVT